MFVREELFALSVQSRKKFNELCMLPIKCYWIIRKRHYIIELKINLNRRNGQQPSSKKYRISQHFHLLLGNILTSKLIYISCMYEICKICR